MCPFSVELFGIECSHLPCSMAYRGLGSILLSPMPYLYAEFSFVNLEQVPSICSLHIFSLHCQLTWKTLPDSYNLSRGLLCPLDFVGRLYYSTSCFILKALVELTLLTDQWAPWQWGLCLIHLLSNLSQCLALMELLRATMHQVLAEVLGILRWMWLHFFLKELTT